MNEDWILFILEPFFLTEACEIFISCVCEFVLLRADRFCQWDFYDQKFPEVKIIWFAFSLSKNNVISLSTKETYFLLAIFSANERNVIIFRQLCG